MEPPAFVDCGGERGGDVGAGGAKVLVVLCVCVVFAVCVCVCVVVCRVTWGSKKGNT